jgi:hypothetical protein
MSPEITDILPASTGPLAEAGLDPVHLRLGHRLAGRGVLDRRMPPGLPSFIKFGCRDRRSSPVPCEPGRFERGHRPERIGRVRLPEPQHLLAVEVADRAVGEGDLEGADRLVPVAGDDLGAAGRQQVDAQWGVRGGPS